MICPMKNVWDDLNRICPDVENAAADTAIVLSQISDDQIFTEMKKDYAKEMVTGFIRLNGMTVGGCCESYKSLRRRRNRGSII